jgi:uncharacterized membrane protein
MIGYIMGIVAAVKKNIPQKQTYDFNYIVIYLLEWLTGILFLIIGNSKRKKLHSIQAIILGVIAIVIAFLPLGILSFILDILIWLAGLYLGYMASTGMDVKIPALTAFVERYVQ